MDEKAAGIEVARLIDAAHRWGELTERSGHEASLLVYNADTSRLDRVVAERNEYALLVEGLRITMVRNLTSATLEEGGPRVSLEERVARLETACRRLATDMRVASEAEIGMRSVALDFMDELNGIDTRAKK